MTPNRAFETDAVQRSALHRVAQRERWADTMMSDEEELTKVHLNLPHHRAVGGESVQLDLIDLLETAMPRGNPKRWEYSHRPMISHGNGH